MQRPMYLPKEKVRTLLAVYLTEAERREIEQKALAAGLGQSAFIRNAALGAPILVIPSGNAKHWESLARVGANLNQIAKAINSHRATGVDIEIINALAEQVRLLRLELTRGVPR